MIIILGGQLSNSKAVAVFIEGLRREQLCDATLIAIDQIEIEKHNLFEEERKMPIFDSVTIRATFNTITTNLTDFIKNAQACKELSYENSDRDSCLQGQREFLDWFAGIVRQAIKRTSLIKLSARQIFQPCWSSRRWKSITSKTKQ